MHLRCLNVIIDYAAQFFLIGNESATKRGFFHQMNFYMLKMYWAFPCDALAHTEVTKQQLFLQYDRLTVPPVHTLLIVY